MGRGVAHNGASFSNKLGGFQERKPQAVPWGRRNPHAHWSTQGLDVDHQSQLHAASVKPHV
jgi:hypothetical protein